MRMIASESAAIAIDIQERLLPVINDGDSIAANSARLISGLRSLDVPVIVPRQYPKGLGDTVPQIKAALGEHITFDKTAFSVCKDEALFAEIKRLEKKNVLIFGIEAHICVLQSVIDLAAAGYTPVLVCDCVGSRFKQDTEIAISRAKAEGAVLTTSEAILFEFLQDAKNEKFKEISNLIK